MLTLDSVHQGSLALILIKTAMDIRFSVAIYVCILHKISLAHTEEAPAMDEPSEDDHFNQWKRLRQVTQCVMVHLFCFYGALSPYTILGLNRR